MDGGIDISPADTEPARSKAVAVAATRDHDGEGRI